MPIPALASMAKKAGISIDKAEKYWDKAKEIAKKADHEKDYDYIMGIVKKMMKLESITVEDLMDAPELHMFVPARGAMFPPPSPYVPRQISASKLIEDVANGEDAFRVVRGLTEVSPIEVKQVAKEIAQKFGGKVAGSKAGWGTDVAKIAKNKFGAVCDWLKSQGYEDVSTKSVYRQLIIHLGKKAKVYAKGKVTVRVADVDEVPDYQQIDPKTSQPKMVGVKDLMISVLYN